MSKTIRLLLLVAAVLAGYTAAVVLGTPEGVEPAATPDPPASTLSTTTSTSLARSAESTSTTADSAEPPVYLVWSTGGLTPELMIGLTDVFANVSIVKGDVVELESDDGVIPLDALAVDPVTHGFFDDVGLLEILEIGSVVLGETSAELRAVEPGDSLMLAGHPFTVAGIVPDYVVSASEVVFHQADPNLPVTTDRFALVATDLDRKELEARVRAMHEGNAPLRLRAEGETPWLRHGDAVLPQVFIKKALGEFSYTGLSNGRFDQSSDFIATRIETGEVPTIGEVTCHRVVRAMLQGAMNQLLEEGLGHLVDPAGFAGCWNPRFIQSVAGSPSGISRHAWGAAVDINARSNPVGSTGSQDPRLVEIMTEWGFTWGGEWLVPDPMHFEYAVDPG